MAGMERGGQGDSIALLAVHFEVDSGNKTPPLEPIRLPNFRPYSLVGGLRELAMAATEPPAAALSKQLLFIPIRDRQTSHMVMRWRMEVCRERCL